MNFSIDNGLSRCRAAVVTAALLLCCNGNALAGVDDAWNASPATQDTSWAQVYAAPVNPSNNGGQGEFLKSDNGYYKDPATGYIQQWGVGHGVITLPTYCPNRIISLVSSWAESHGDYENIYSTVISNSQIGLYHMKWGQNGPRQRYTVVCY
ncbi:hypothetical protein [Aeromonas veronii]|uniref:hypothetical protein n=1 Tax=Aeromonas veronii TaxID=654 RepID=UPI001F32F5E0|nr:hypothetical protein [Aeromonas veronii]MCF5901240.1 hypothetical protein [Aeromonas veronii]